MSSKKIVITGGPGTGKSSIIDHLEALDYTCFNEISREITLQARKDGIEQLFLTDPLLFSQKLLEGRIAQYKKSQRLPKEVVFLDRGIPDILAYMDFVGDVYPPQFNEAARSYIYDKVFVLAPWQEIFVSDSERYESFEEATKIHHCLLDTYQHFGYDLIDVPFNTVDKRTHFILKALNLK